MPLLAGKILQFGFVAYVLAILLFLLGLALWVDPLGLFTPASPLNRWLDACPENGVRFACNMGRGSHNPLYGHIDFDKGNLEIEEDPLNDGASIQTRDPRSIYSIPINPGQREEIAHVIEIMPEQKMTFLQSYDFDHDIYFSLWKDHQLQIYGYAKNALPQEISGLLKSFRVNLNDAIN